MEVEHVILPHKILIPTKLMLQLTLWTLYSYTCVQMPVPIIAELIPLLPLLRTVAKVLDHDPLATDLLNAKISTIPYFDNVKVVENFFDSWDSSYALRIDDQQGMTYVRGGSLLCKKTGC